MGAKTQRLDCLLVERGLFPSRERAQAAILAGEVWSGAQRMDKPGTRVAEDFPLEIRARTTPFASRAGLKLSHALETFQIEVRGLVCLDVGASTGGFTDCLLQRNARHVFAVDVGYGQLEQKLRADTRVTVVERTNARYLKRAELEALSPLATEIRFLCMDVSFISLRKIIEPLRGEFPSIQDWLLLFKPQFEVGKKDLGRGGVVRSEEAVKSALEDFQRFMEGLGFAEKGHPLTSPIAGKKSGNVEYLIYYALPQ